MRTITFAKRNFIELVKDPIATIFFIVFPSVLFIVLQLIMKGLNIPLDQTPQFEITHMTGSMIVFSFSFITIFVGNVFANDRESSFLLRLKSTPMKSFDFIFGYTLAFLPIALIQEIVMVIIALCFGLNFSLNVLLTILILFPMSLLFIGLGLLLGSLISSKVVGPLASIGPTACGFLGGMFFPLENIPSGNAFKIICQYLPFYPSIDVANKILNGVYSDILVNYLITISYTIILYILSVLVISINLKRDKI